VPYPRKLLNPEEEIALDLRPHWWYFSKHILTGIPLFILLILVLQMNGNLGKVSKWAWALLAVAWVIWLGFKYVAWVFTYFVVTNERIIFRTGFIAKHGVEIPLSRINNINFDQGIFNRIIGAGDLLIESAGKESNAKFDNVRHPDAVQQVIYNQMETRQKTEASWVGTHIGEAERATAAAPPRDSAKQIEELARLRDQGHITPEEYEAKKSELLGRM